MPMRISKKNLPSRINEHPVLVFNNRRKELTFYFEGKKMKGFAGETIAAALIANGVKVFRYTEKHKRARGFFCAVGKCSSCLMMVDGKPNTMICVEPLREGIRVERQHGRGKI